MVSHVSLGTPHTQALTARFWGWDFHLLPTRDISVIPRLRALAEVWH